MHWNICGAEARRGVIVVCFSCRELLRRQAVMGGTAEYGRTCCGDGINLTFLAGAPLPTHVGEWGWVFCFVLFRSD